MPSPRTHGLHSGRLHRKTMSSALWYTDHWRQHSKRIIRVVSTLQEVWPHAPMLAGARQSGLRCVVGCALFTKIGNDAVNDPCQGCRGTKPGQVHKLINGWHAPEHVFKARFISLIVGNMGDG